MIEIRRAQVNDVPGLVDLWEEFMDFHSALDSGFVRSPDASKNWAEYITTKLADDEFRVYVATSEGTLAGYVVATVTKYPPIFTLEHFGFIQEIAVAAPFRQQGIGRRLFETAEKWLLTKDVSHIELKVDVSNEVSRSFWTNEGFTLHTEILIKKSPVDLSRQEG